MARPITDEDRAEIRRLHAEGKGRNDIARALRRSGQTISKLAAEMGLSFERGDEVRAATEARQADLAELRTQLAYDLTTDAMRLRAQLWEPAIVFNFGGKDNDYNSREVSEPPARDKRDLMLTAGAAIDRSLKLVPPKENAGEEEARSVLGRIMAGLTQVWHEQQAQGEGDGDAP